MALVICSNIRDDIIYQRNADYDAAYSFHNSLKQTLKIDPDSEVAVQSVKLSKSSNIIVKESDQWFQYFGKDLHKSGTTADDGPYYPIQCNPAMPVGFPSKSVNMEDFAALIKKGMNIGMPLPTAYGLMDFEVARDAAGAYKLFTYEGDELREREYRRRSIKRRWIMGVYLRERDTESHRHGGRRSRTGIYYGRRRYRLR